MKPLYIRAALLAILYLSGARRVAAQLPVIDPVEDAESAVEEGIDYSSLEVQLKIAQTAANTLSALAGTESATESTQSTIIAYYNLAQKMNTAPASDYTTYSNKGTVVWAPVTAPQNVYGNSQQWMAAATTGTGASAAVQSTSIPTTGQLSGYNQLASDGQQAIAATGATIDLQDAVSETSLSVLGVIRSNASQREADIATLEAATHSTDPNEQTVMSELQRLDQALLIDLRAQQDRLQIQQSDLMQEVLDQKSENDALKSSMQAANNYENNFKTHISPAPLKITANTSH